jgi:hypothetical protein
MTISISLNTLAIQIIPHMVNCQLINTYYYVSGYEYYACDKTIMIIFQNEYNDYTLHKHAILCGGYGLYLMSTSFFSTVVYKR